MRKCLLYWTKRDESAYGKVFSNNDRDEFHLLLDDDVDLPRGTFIYIIDPESEFSVQLVVIGYYYELELNLLRILVVTNDSIEIPPKQFRIYIKKNWLGISELEKKLNGPYINLN